MGMGLRIFNFRKWAITKQYANSQIYVAYETCFEKCWTIEQIFSIVYNTFILWFPAYLRLIMICALQEVLAFWLYSFSLLLLVMGLWLYFFHWYVWLFWLWPFYFFFPPPWFGSFDVKIWVSSKFLYPSLSLHVLNIRDLINLYWYL
jgi:hypothetical protein